MYIFGSLEEIFNKVVELFGKGVFISITKGLNNNNNVVFYVFKMFYTYI